MKTKYNFNYTDVKVFALGGLEEVGKNMYVIEYKDEIIIIDSGVLFPGDSLPGVDYVIPDYTYLKENNDKIKGLFITHGHEDHIGGIPYLLKEVRIPTIYANGLSVGLIKRKLADFPELSCNIYEFDEDEVIAFDHLKVEFYRNNHSIPDSFGIIVKTHYGYIVHTGDFKFDFTPISQDANYQKMAAIGSKGVLCLLSDSTNSQLKDFSTSEKVVAENIKDLFKSINGRVIIATFASNVHRINQIISSSLATKRKIAIVGRSMKNALEAGRELGYIEVNDNDLVDIDLVGYYNADRTTILCTGSQGEPFSALTRIANGMHKQIHIKPGDTVIFSSSAIPGNTDGIGKVINLLSKQGARVITQSPFNDVHATGHGGQHELLLAMKLFKPKYFMPIHGEYHMLKVHGDIAIDSGIQKENIFLLSNGQVLTFNKSGAKVTDRVQNGVKYIEGEDQSETSSKVIKERKTIGDNGIVGIVTYVDSTNNLLFRPQIVSRGFIYVKDNEELYEKITKFISGYYKKNYSLTNFKEEFIKALSKFILVHTNQSPLITLTTFQKK